MKTLELTNSQGVRWSWISAWCDGGSVAEWLRHRTWNLVIPSSRPALPTIWICSRFWFNSSGALVQSQLVCFLSVGIDGLSALVRMHASFRTGCSVHILFSSFVVLCWYLYSRSTSAYGCQLSTYLSNILLLLSSSLLRIVSGDKSNCGGVSRSDHAHGLFW